MIGPCLCGDTECPRCLSCGGALGTYPGVCEACGEEVCENQTACAEKMNAYYESMFLDIQEYERR
jgi:hypothetical protein